MMFSDLCVCSSQKNGKAIPDLQYLCSKLLGQVFHISMQRTVNSAKVLVCKFPRFHHYDDLTICSPTAVICFHSRSYLALTSPSTIPEAMDGLAHQGPAARDVVTQPFKSTSSPTSGTRLVASLGRWIPQPPWQKPLVGLPARAPSRKPTPNKATPGRSWGHVFFEGGK